MYLLMLLATFVSALYGYNLSARADYDRVIPKRKAEGLLYKFIVQEDIAKSFVFEVNTGNFVSVYGLNWMLSGDKIFADFGNSSVTSENEYLYYLPHGESTKLPFYVRKHQAPEAIRDSFSDRLTAGRHFFNGDDMVSQVLCTTTELQEAGTGDIAGPQEAEGGEGLIIGSGCSLTLNRFLVTYKEIDPRWVNRITNGVTLDFMAAIAGRRYTDNIGLITWNGSNWHFHGKICFEPVYRADQLAWEQRREEAIAAVQSEEGGTPEQEALARTAYYPLGDRERMDWDLPAVFTRNFFTDKNGHRMCDRGCLFKIRAI